MIKLSPQELFDLGVAYGLFSTGDIVAAVNTILPGTDTETDELVNIVFQDLSDAFLHTGCTTPKEYMNVLVVWTAIKDLYIGRPLYTQEKQHDRT